MSVAGILTIQLDQFYTRIIGDGTPVKPIKATFNGKVVKGRTAQDKIYTSEYKSHIKRVKLSETQLSYFQSKESAPNKPSMKSKWKFMNSNQRLHWHLEQIAEGRDFKFERVE